METKTICRLLIAIFTLLSALFFLLYSKEYKIKNTLLDDFVVEAVSNLNHNGIKITHDTIMKNIPTMDIYTISYDDLLDNNEIVSKAIIKNAYSESITTTKFDIPEGYSIGVYDENDSSRELGRVVFYDDDMSFKFSSNGINISGVNSPIINGNLSDINAATRTKVKNIVENLTFNYDIEYEWAGSSTNDGIEIVTVIQKIDDYAINGAYMNFVFDEQKLIMSNGKWITGKPERRYNVSLIDGINVLYKIKLENVSEILEEKLVYSYKKTENNKYYLIPVWEITYLDLNENIVVEFIDTL